MNPFGFAYSSLDGVEAFAKPGGIIVTGRGNRYHETFQTARKKGAEVWMYSDPLEVPDNLSNPQDAEYWLLPDGSRPPLWPYKDKNGNPRRNWHNAKLLDIRPGSAWLKHIIPKHGEFIERHLFDGFMLDTMGARPWSRTRTVNGVVIPGADWETWPTDEQSLWAACCVNIAREIADECAKHSPMMKLCHNNNWILEKSHPAYATALNGEKYCNGLVLENTVGNVPSEFHKALAGRTFGLMPRRVCVVDTTDADAILWSKVPGVTHVCAVESAKGESYAKITPPVVPYDGVPADEVTEENSALRERVAELTAANTDLEKANESLHATIDDLRSRLNQITPLSAQAATIAGQIATLSKL